MLNLLYPYSKLLQLPAASRRLLLEAAVALTVARLALWCPPFRVWSARPAPVPRPQRLFARHSYPATLYIGVTRSPESGFAAHAWLEHEGRVLPGYRQRLLHSHPLPLTMSAIAGIVNLAGGPVDTMAFDRMSQAGVARGPDVHLSWTAGSAAFDYRGISPSWSAGPEQQLVHDDASGVTALLCGRIDGHASSHAGLLLSAYLSLGSAFADQLIGEFAFAVWDPAHRTLTLGRDPGGVGQLFYTLRPDGSVRFATGLNQLLASPGIDRKPDIEGIRDFHLTRGTTQPGVSLISGIRRVPPASMVVITSGHVSVRPYWNLEQAIARTEWIPPAELPDACAEALQNAIRDRVRGQATVGLQLSGGWDSGAIFQLWQWMRSRGESLAEPRVYSYYYSGYPEMDERREIAALLRRWPAPATIAPFECAGALPGLRDHCAELGTPEANFMWRPTRNLAAKARHEGVRVMLNGEGGNHIFECSHLRTADLLFRGRWRAAAEQNRIFARECGRVPPRRFWLSDARHILGALLSRPIRPVGYLASWQERQCFRNLTREYSTLGSVPYLEGVVVSSPFVDARVVPLALRGMRLQPRPSGSRSFLAAAIATRLGASNWRGKYAYANRPFAETTRRDLTAHPHPSRVVDLGLVDSYAFGSISMKFRTGDDSELHTIWQVLTLEAWATSWLG